MRNLCVLTPLRGRLLDDGWGMSLWKIDLNMYLFPALVELATRRAHTVIEVGD